MKIEQNEKRKRKREKGKKEEKIIVLMASRRKELGRVKKEERIRLTKPLQEKGKRCNTGDFVWRSEA